MRRTALAAALIAPLLLATACSGSSGSAPTSGSAASTAAAQSPSASASALPSVSASASPSPSPSPSSSAGDPVAIPATVTGLHVAGVQDGAWPDANVPFGALRLWDAGTAWSQIETARGKYNWTLLDRSLANAEKHGIKDVLLVLGSTPTWNASSIQPTDYPVPGAASAPKSTQAWDAFVKATVTRYKGRIRAYQIWNEASLAMFWNGSPELMADLTKRAYDIIKEVDPKARVVAASTTVRLNGSFNRFFPRYLDALAAKGWPVDVFSAHLYPNSRGTSDTRGRYIDRVKKELADAGAPKRPLWDTELDYGLAGPGPSNPLTPISGAEARDWVIETEFDSLANGVSRTYWYIWTPKPYPLLGMQLTNDSGAVQGLRIVQQWIVGGTTTGCTDIDGVTSCRVAKDDVPSVIAWADDTSGVLAVPDGFTQVCSTSNECTDAAGELTVTETPVRLLP